MLHKSMRSAPDSTSRTPDAPAFDGIIPVNKPLGLTSARVVERVRRRTGFRKCGHAGTLDPAADGVLLICCGRGTKLVERLMDLPKSYRATARLDVTSDSFDSDCPRVLVETSRVPRVEEVVDAARAFVGLVQQAPPALSAVKIGGRPSYALARAGRAPSPAARPVRIDRLSVLRYDWPVVEFEMDCGRGTYVRSLIRDWGAALGVGGCLTALTRTRVGPFEVQNCILLNRVGLPDASGFLTLNEIEALLMSENRAAD